jgi:geranylgeranylglycerol-phosphate geranylgeranyltransferase
LVRPVNCLLGSASVLVAAYLAGGSPARSVVLWLATSAGLIAGAGNVLNDYFDVEIDRLGKPARVLPSGRMDRPTALLLSVSLSLGGVLLSCAGSLATVGVAIGASVLLALYGAALKRRGLPGNLVVSLLGGLAFVYGGLAVGRPAEALLPASFAFLFHLGREIIKDGEDAEADRGLGATSVAVRFGPRAATDAAGLCFLALVAVTPVPSLTGRYGAAYLPIVLIGVDLFLVIVYAWLRRSPTIPRFRSVARLLKIDMVIGLCALILGKATG